VRFLDRISVFGSRQPPAQSSGYNPTNSHDSATQSVSLIHLIANPEQWDGKKMLLNGYLHLEFEGDALYLHKEDYDQSIYSNSIWVNLPRDMTEMQRKAVNDGYVLCEGTFHSKDHGHMGLFSGTLTQINRIEPWGHATSR
jgi:hypothetical protein